MFLHCFTHPFPGMGNPIPIVIVKFFILNNFTINDFNNLTELHSSFKPLNLHINMELFAQFL